MALAWGALLASCGARSALLLEEADAAAPVPTPVDPPPCVGERPICATRDRDQPCAAARLVAAVCDANSGVLSCPTGAWPLQTHADKPSVCRIGDAPDAPITAMAGSITRIPTEDERCILIADAVRTKDGVEIPNVAFEIPQRSSFRTCPRQLAYVGGRPQNSIVTPHFGENTRIQITGGYLLAGKSQLTFRRFRADPQAVFGFTEEGTGIGRWDTRLERVVLDAPDPSFNTELDYGNASFASGHYAYIWGCNRPTHDPLLEGCVLGRIDASPLFPELYLGNRVWSRTPEAAAGAIVFTDGPWISSVVANTAQPGQLQHFFIPAFGRTLRVRSATSPEGPWGDDRAMAALNVASKPVFAAGPVVHEQLADPTHPEEVVVSYDVDTTDPAVTDHLSFGWSQLEWVSR